MSRETVLIVEDDDDSREMYRTTLAVAGYDVKEAANGLEGLRRIDALLPDVIVLDMMLPYVSGYGILFDLAKQPHTRNIPVVVVTGSGEEIREVPPDCVLRKPVAPAQLVRTVHRCLTQPRH